jgi:hypothetical protein
MHCGPDCNKAAREAEQALSDYIAKKYQPARRRRDIEAIDCADVLSIYLSDAGGSASAPLLLCPANGHRERPQPSPDVDVVAYRREERPYLTRMGFVVKDHVRRRLSVSIADTTPKRSLGVFVSKRGKHSRPKEISLLSATLRRNLVPTWSQPHVKTPIAVAATTGGIFVCALELGQSNIPHFNALDDRSAQMACGPSRGNRIKLR